MSRRLAQRLKIRGTLRARTAFHVGGFGQDVESDMPLARNGRGQFYLPGTSLAGPIRDWFCSSFTNSGTIDALWGFQLKDKGHASYVMVEDAVVTLPAAATIEVRDGVGIDRVRGAAAAGIKYDRAVIPRGATLTLALSVELPSLQGSAENMAHNSQIRAMFGELLLALKKGAVAFGAARTRGLGKLELQDGVSIVEETLDTPAGILDFLMTGGKTLKIDDLIATGASPVAQAATRLKLEIHWHPCTPVMVKAGYEGIAVDTLPLVSGNDGEVSLVLPGSAIKGSLRSQAERIIRTLLGTRAPDDPSDRQNFLKQVCVPLVNTVFGMAGQRDETGTGSAVAAPEVDDDDYDDEDGDTQTGGEASAGNERASGSASTSAAQEPRLGRGALSVADCYGTTTFPAENWRAIVTAPEDLPLAQELKKAGLGSWHEEYHVAIDRWTGGAAEGALYSVLEPHGAKWGPITLTLDLERLRREEMLPGVALLLLVLRDFAEEKIPLGFGTHRGMGWLAVDRVEITGTGLGGVEQKLAQLEQVSLEKGCVGELPEELLNALSTAWENWIKTARAETPK